MKYLNVYLTDESVQVIPLSTTFFNINSLKDALEDSETVEDLQKRLFYVDNKDFAAATLERNSVETIRFKLEGCGFWNTKTRFLIIKKEGFYSVPVNLV